MQISENDIIDHNTHGKYKPIYLNVSVCVELVIVCVSINPMIAHSVFMTIGCCVSCGNVTSFEQTSKILDY